MLIEPNDASINLRSLREGRGWTQEELAARLGVERAHVSSLESGRRRITLNMMQKLMILFDLKYEDFFRKQGG